MRILLATYAFFPNVGGLEEVNALLAEAFVARGHAVKIVTMTPAGQPDTSAYEILRRPKVAELIRAIRWCDVFLQANVGFRLGWPNFLIRRPWVIALHGNLDAEEGRDGVFAWKSRVKRLSLHNASRVVAVSVVGPSARLPLLWQAQPTRSSCSLVLCGSLTICPKKKAGQLGQSRSQTARLRISQPC